MKLNDLQYVLMCLDVPFMVKVENNKIVLVVYSKKTEQVVSVLYFTLDGERVDDRPRHYYTTRGKKVLENKEEVADRLGTRLSWGKVMA